jgi:aminomethyltransferase
MKKLGLSDIHESLGAKMVEFAGFYMPVQYEGVNAEHQAVRQKVGVFDVSHMGEVFVKGENAEKFLQYISSNDVSKLNPGKVQYSYLPNKKGGVVDDFLLYMIAENEYMLVLNASNLQKDIEWIHAHNTFDCKIDNQSDNYSLLAVQGPESITLLQQLTAEDLSALKYYNFIIGTIAGVDDVVISRTGYTGEVGFELYVRNENVKQLWDALFTADIDVNPIGLAARDTLRLEKGFCLYGNDIDETTSPLEAGLGWITKFSTSFINAENLQKQKDNGLKRKLAGIELIDRGIARKDYIVLNAKDEEIGIITSGTMSPTLKKSIAMTYILTEYSEIDQQVFVQIRNKKIKAKIVEVPFVK